MKLILRTIFNFIKFAVINLAMMSIFLVAYLKIEVIKPIWLFEVSVLIIEFITCAFDCKRKYIVFCKKDLRQNIASVIFIIAGLLWMYFVYAGAVIMSYGYSVTHYMG